ncbi:integrase catalytic domain-containing protein [Trichonephila clavipes]|nr:integrase catalytic domain-containing protein [Trichonephila clavipes]
MLWTDSNIVLAWIQRSPEQHKTFIGNRIKIIQRLTQNCQWNHVSSNENPADLISRGLNASDISSKQLWWHGPDFLREELEANPIDFERITSDNDLSKRSNNYTKFLHLLSYIFRFLHNSRNPSVKRSGQLDYSEVNEAELCLIKNLQASAFQLEIEFLAKSSCNLKKDKLFSLNPFLDGNQILRVGGRLQNSDLTYTSKAVHLEIVSDLTTDAFLATLKRFVARRGKCATISSDNAKNFVGANRELKRLHNLVKFPEEKLSFYLSSEGISWNLMPPRAPNFGGLWAAGVKLFKF